MALGAGRGKPSPPSVALRTRSRYFAGSDWSFARRNGMPRTPQELSDDELDAHILARLELLGVDLTVLPEDDSDAPADQRRILASARRFLRSTPGTISSFVMDVQDVPPLLYPGEWSGRTGETP